MHHSRDGLLSSGAIDYGDGMSDTFIREMRRRAELSVPELARATGVSETAAWKWDRGESLPREKFVEAIARALKVESGDLRANLVRTASSELQARHAPVDRALEHAKNQIAKALKIDRERIQLRLTIADLGMPLGADAMAEQGNLYDAPG